MAQGNLSKPANSINRAWAVLFARLVLGLIFFMAGVAKVFQLGPLEHARKYFLPLPILFFLSGLCGPLVLLYRLLNCWRVGW